MMMNALSASLAETGHDSRPEPGGSFSAEGKSTGTPERPLSIRVEPDVDFEETAKLAAAGFGAPAGSFKPNKLRWLYQDAFSKGSTVLSVYDRDTKVGQVVLIHQSVRLGGRLESAIALVDLFILKEFRSRQVMADLYGEVERFCKETSVRLILAVPNGNGARVNVRYLGLADFMKLDIRAGFCRPWRGRGVAISANLSEYGQSSALALFSRFLPSETAGLFWTPQSLWGRFQDTDGQFGVHASENLLLISSPRTSRGIAHTLFCAFFLKPGATVRRRDVAEVARAACALHRRPLFIYAGKNRDVPLPGLSIPERLRPSAMMVQIRDFQAAEQPSFDRFELLDFDFA